MSNAFHRARSHITSTLESFGIEPDEAVAEANLLLDYVSGFGYAQRVASDLQELPLAAASKIEAVLARRRKREPIQYCLGEADFAGMKLMVQSGVFIPRSDTESVLEVMLSWVNRNPKLKKIRIADIGTGAGPIIIAALKALPHATGWACDLSETALAVAKANAERHGVLDRLELQLGDWVEHLPSEFDLIGSNPPYIPRRLRAALAPEVRDYEPDLALFVDDSEGLSFYRQMAEKLPRHFKKEGGFLALEFGDGQAESIAKLFSENWTNVRTSNDLNGLPRVLSAER